MNKIIIILIVICLIVLIFGQNRLVEGNNGAILQLVAKGPQDTYLTGDAWKHIPWWYYNYPYYNYPYYY